MGCPRRGWTGRDRHTDKISAAQLSPSPNSPSPLIVRSEYDYYEERSGPISIDAILSERESVVLYAADGTVLVSQRQIGFRLNSL